MVSGVKFAAEVAVEMVSHAMWFSALNYSFRKTEATLQTWRSYPV